MRVTCQFAKAIIGTRLGIPIGNQTMRAFLVSKPQRRHTVWNSPAGRVQVTG
jgi:hypothetical protein